MPTNVVVTMLFNGLQHTDEVSKPQACLQGSLTIFFSHTMNLTYQAIKKETLIYYSENDKETN